MDHQNGLISLFTAIDTVLNLHYASSITTPQLNDVCRKATAMSGKRIDASTLEQILAVFPEAYKIIFHGRNSYDYSITVPAGVPVRTFGTQLPARKRKLELLLPKNGPVDPIKLQTVAVLETPLRSPKKSDRASLSPSVSPTKSSPTKISKASLLRNDLSKFLFKEKLAAVEASSHGLSLLERIRLKEKQQQSQESPQAKYQTQIRGKMPSVYDVIYELANSSNLEADAPKSRTFPLNKVVSIVKDSLAFEIAESEVLDVINELQSVLGTTKMQIVQREQVRVMRVYQLDRNQDLASIK